MPASSDWKASCRSGAPRSTVQAARPHWIKTKNPAAPAVKREAEEDWGGWSEKPRHSRRWATSAATAAAIYSSIAARAGAITWDAKGDVRERRRIETRMRKSG